MTHVKQVFQTNSPVRWRAFKWTGRLLVFVLLLMIPIVIFSLAKGYKPLLPLLNNSATTAHFLKHPVATKDFNARELKKYGGFNDFLVAKHRMKRMEKTAAGQRIDSTEAVRAAFFVDWDPQSLYSLQKNIGHLNMVLPEWFFIDPSADTLKPAVDLEALALMKQNNVRIIPVMNNINPQKGEGDFDGDIVKRIIHNKQKKERLINDIVRYLKQYHLQGINVDFEELSENTDKYTIAFEKQLYGRLHADGLMVTQNIIPGNEDFNVKELSLYNDYLFLMAYDQHYTTSEPGPVSAQKWIEKVLDETAADVPSKKIIVCIAGYGYDWPDNSEATSVTYEEALANAKEYHASIDFDNDTYNNYYSYSDGSGVHHKVYYTDAITNFNTMRFADEYGTAGTALWRLGSEDDRLWTFYNRDMSNKGMQKKPFDYSALKLISSPAGKPDYIGEGEILNVISEPQKGVINLEVDSTENIITEQYYLQLPTKYVIRKYGNVNHQVILTFDDGPDPEYTPQILDILKREKVPGSFFVVGMEAEDNLPLLKRIFREGYEIGNHTFTHPNIAAVSNERALTEMETTRLLIEAVTGHSTILFRAPYNADAEPTLEVELKPVALSRDNNYYSVGESIDPNDWEEGVTADSVYYRTIRQYEANPSKGIILLHDAGGNRQATVDALPRIIHYFKNRGVQFTTVANLLGKTKDMVMPPVHDSLVHFDRHIFGFGYWVKKLMGAVFWTAIILGLARILFMAVLAVLQKIRTGRYRRRSNTVILPQPHVSIIIPAFNEEVNAVKTIDNLLRQDYPFFDIIFVDDGSKDDTWERVSTAYSGHERVRAFTIPNGGKASALNYGISQSSSGYVICIDADTQLKHDAVSSLMSCFFDAQALSGKGEVGAVAGNVKVGNERTLITRWQSIEYATAQNFDRRAFDYINGITVVPGAIGAFKKSAIKKAGGFTTDTLAEDCDLTIRILRNGYTVRNCTEAIAVTEAPETYKQFMKQRFRWSYGIMQSFWKNRDACFNPKFGALGMVALPNVLLFQVLLPIISPLADIMLLFSLVWNRNDASSLHKVGLFYLVFLAVDVLVSMLAFSFEKENMKKLVWIIPQRFVYRQMIYIILFKAIAKAIKGENQGWGVLNRTGNVKIAVNGSLG